MRHAFSSAFGAPYWALYCSHCTALQGENFFKPHPGKQPQEKAQSAMHGQPDLMALPMLGGQPQLGGVMNAKVFMHRFVALQTSAASG